MSVSYDKDMKAKAKLENKALYTLATTWPGGKPAMVVQGYADEKMIEECHAFFARMRAMGDKAFKGKKKKL